MSAVCSGVPACVTKDNLLREWVLFFYRANSRASSAANALTYCATSLPPAIYLFTAQDFLQNPSWPHTSFLISLPPQCWGGGGGWGHAIGRDTGMCMGRGETGMRRRGFCPGSCTVCSLDFFFPTCWPDMGSHPSFVLKLEAKDSGSLWGGSAFLR